MVVNYEDGLYYDHSTDSGGDMIDLWCAVKGISPSEAKDEIEDWWELLLASPEDMNRLAQQAGWTLDRTFGPRNLYVGLLRKE